MSQSSSDVRATARNAKAALLQVLRDELSRTQVAQRLGTHKSTVNRLINSHAEDLFAVLAVAGFKVVPADALFVSEGDLEALRRLASRGLESMAPHVAGA